MAWQQNTALIVGYLGMMHATTKEKNDMLWLYKQNYMFMCFMMSYIYKHMKSMLSKPR